MTGDMDDKHYENVLAFDPEERYTYFVTTVCDSDAVFSLAIGEDMPTVEHLESGRAAFPVWPHARLAAACADGDLDGYEPKSIDLDDFLEFCDRLRDDEALVAVMMYPDSSFLTVEPEDLKRDIEEWREQAHDPDAQPRD
jgi:hypothetical protein